MPTNDEANVAEAEAPAVDGSWHRCRSFSLTGRRVDLACASPALGTRFDQLLAAMADAAPPLDRDVPASAPAVDLRVDVVTTGLKMTETSEPRAEAAADRYDLWLDGNLHSRCHHQCCCEQRVLSLVNRLALDGDPERLHLHSGLVALGARAALVVGASGSGKSTLVAWLSTAGWTYLSDEMVSIDANGELDGYPRPLTLKEGSWPLFDGLPSLALNAVATAHVGCGRAQIAPLELGPPRPTAPVWPAIIVFVSHGAPVTQIVPIPAREALLRMIPEVLDLERSGVEGMQRLVDLTTAAPAARLEINELESVDDVLRAAMLSAPKKSSPISALPGAAASDGERANPERVTGSMRAVLAATCRVWPIDDGGALYDLDSGAVLQLDGPAMAMLEALDGSRSLDAIASEQATVSDGADGVSDVVELVRALAGLGLVDTVTDAASR